MTQEATIPVSFSPNYFGDIIAEFCSEEPKTKNLIDFTWTNIKDRKDEIRNQTMFLMQFFALKKVVDKYDQGQRFTRRGYLNTKKLAFMNLFISNPTGSISGCSFIYTPGYKADLIYFLAGVLFNSGNQPTELSSGLSQST